MNPSRHFTLRRRQTRHPTIRGSGTDWMKSGKIMSKRFPPVVSRGSVGKSSSPNSHEVEFAPTPRGSGTDWMKSGKTMSERFPAAFRCAGRSGCPGAFVRLTTLRRTASTWRLRSAMSAFGGKAAGKTSARLELENSQDQNGQGPFRIFAAQINN